MPPTTTLPAAGAVPAETATHLVATGFTTAFLGDERTLREFIVADHVRTTLARRGLAASLTLINDTYDPLTRAQLRVALKRHPARLAQTERFCGQPIAFVPDPFSCHASYAAHFCAALLRRLHVLGIHPEVIDTAAAYAGGRYAPYLDIVFERAAEIRAKLAEHFPTVPVTLFRPLCPHCGRLDATTLGAVDAHAADVACEGCGQRGPVARAELRGKLAWKVDCAVRWNLYGIGTEVFSKQHTAPLGTVPVASLLSREFFGGRMPSVVPYGAVKMDAAVAGQLLLTLPPPVLKRIFQLHATRDLQLTPALVLARAAETEIAPGRTFLAYVRRDLPVAALARHTEPAAVRTRQSRRDRRLVGYANRFSQLHFGRSFGLRALERDAFEMFDAASARTASRLLDEVVRLREAMRGASVAATRAAVDARLRADAVPQTLYRGLRRAFSQPDGPSLPTLLVLLPTSLLAQARDVLANRTILKSGPWPADEEPPEAERSAA